MSWLNDIHQSMISSDEQERNNGKQGLKDYKECIKRLFGPNHYCGSIGILKCLVDAERKAKGLPEN